jgi:hypothetical protein
MPAPRRFYPTKVEFGLSADGTSAPTTWEEILQADLVEPQDVDLERFRTSTGHEYMLRSVSRLIVQTTDTQQTALATLKGHQSNAVRTVWVRVHYAGGDMVTYKNCSVLVAPNVGRPDRPDMVRVEFVTTSADGSEILFS